MQKFEIAFKGRLHAGNRSVADFPGTQVVEKHPEIIGKFFVETRLGQVLLPEEILKGGDILAVCYNCLGRIILFASKVFNKLLEMFFT
jgi:hypothetical protein